MAATVSGSATISTTYAPHLTGTVISALFAIAPENMTVAQVLLLADLLNHLPGGHAPATVVGSLVA